MQGKETIKTLKAIADERRFRIVEELREKDLFEQELLAIVNLAPSTLAHHLKILMDCGLIIRTTMNRNALFSLSLEKLNELAFALTRGDTVYSKTLI